LQKPGVLHQQKGKRGRGGRIPKVIEDPEICQWWMAAYCREREERKISLDFPNSNSESMKDLLTIEITPKQFFAISFPAD
jgi:hypothetical protein